MCRVSGGANGWKGLGTEARRYSTEQVALTPAARPNELEVHFPGAEGGVHSCSSALCFRGQGLGLLLPPHKRPDSFTLTGVPIYLLSHLRLGPKFQEAPSKGGSCLKVLELEEEVEGGPQHQDHVHRLQVRVGEVGCHLADRRRDTCQAEAAQLHRSTDHFEAAARALNRTPSKQTRD